MPDNSPTNAATTDELERDKLREELRQLKKPWYRKFGNLVSLVTVVCLAGGLVGQYKWDQVSLEGAKNDLAAAKLELKGAILDAKTSRDSCQEREKRLTAAIKKAESQAQDSQAALAESQRQAKVAEDNHRKHAQVIEQKMASYVRELDQFKTTTAQNVEWAGQIRVLKRENAELTNRYREALSQIERLQDMPMVIPNE